MDVDDRSSRRLRAGRTRQSLWLCLGVMLLVSASALMGREQYEEQYEVVFEGRPGKRVIIGYTQAGWTVLEEGLDRDDSEEYLARIVKDRRGNHFWASREMRPMAREESEGFVTYLAGRYGYVKTSKEAVLDVVRGAGAFEPGHEYMEHVIDVLYSVNYWGTRTDY